MEIFILSDDRRKGKLSYHPATMGIVEGDQAPMVWRTLTRRGAGKSFEFENEEYAIAPWGVAESCRSTFKLEDLEAGEAA